MIRSYYGVLYSYYIVPFGTPTMEYFPKELDYISANFGAMCKRPPNKPFRAAPTSINLQRGGVSFAVTTSINHVGGWERRIAHGKAKDGAKDQIASG